MRLTLNTKNEANLVHVLRKGNSFIPELFLVSEMNNNIVGHILFTQINIVNDTGEAYSVLSLAPISVLPQRKNQGIEKPFLNIQFTLHLLDCLCIQHYTGVLPSILINSFHESSSN